MALPEIYHEFAGLPQMVRSYQKTTLVAPIPGPLHSRIRASQGSQVLYEAYLAARSGSSFLTYCRTHIIGKGGVRTREKGLGHAAGKQTMAVGVRFHYELLDIFHGEWASVFFPHASRMAFYAMKPLIEFSRFYAGVILYLMSLDYAPDTDRQQVMADAVGTEGGVALARLRAKVSDYPGTLPQLPMTRATAVNYYREIVADELAGRVSRCRVSTWLERTRAVDMLLIHLGTERGSASIPLWDRKATATLAEVTLSETQAEFSDHVMQQVELSDANVLDAGDRISSLSGDPGSGKTEAPCVSVCVLDGMCVCVCVRPSRPAVPSRSGRSRPAVSPEFGIHSLEKGSFYPIF